MGNRYNDLAEQTSNAIAERKMIIDADGIVQGACNPVATSRVLTDMICFISDRRGHDAVKKHPAIRAVLDHLNVIILGTNNLDVPGCLYTELGKALDEVLIT